MRGAFRHALLGLLLAAPALAGPGVVPTGFQDQLVVGALRRPIGMAFVPGGRVLVAEQKTARLRLLVNGALAAVDPVVTVPNVRTAGNEQGLLGVALDPAWPARPYVYVHYNYALAATIQIARFTVTGDLDHTGTGSLSIDPASRYTILADIPDANANHNGGTLRFGPDGMLYASLGEDFDPCTAQDTVSLRGVILRLDVADLPAGPGGPPAKSLIAPADNPLAGHADPNAWLVWVLGVRNPFRFTIDTTGEIFIGDVGEGAWEEINRVASGGTNLGWPLFEGTDPHLACPGIGGAGMTGPIHAYPQSLPGSYAVMAGPVYRAATCGGSGSFAAAYVGDLFFSDYYKGFLRRLEGAGAAWALAAAVPGQPNATDWGTGFAEVSDWQVGCDGALWYCRQSVGFQDNTGEIRKVVSTFVAEVPPGATYVQFAAPYPSPAPGAVTFDFSLAAPAPVSLTIHDLHGRTVATLVPGEVRFAGRHREVWSGRDADGGEQAAGIYFVRLAAHGRVFRHRFVRL